MKTTMYHGGNTNRIELNIFTNSTSYAPSLDLIQSTYESFTNQFGFITPVKIWYNPFPNVKDSKIYKKNLESMFDNVTETSSLSDGYIRSIQESNSEFLFMLEHDWDFLDIESSLEDICKQMNEYALVHLRFNKRSNLPVAGDAFGLTQINGTFFPFCRTGFVSMISMINVRFVEQKKEKPTHSVALFVKERHDDPKLVLYKNPTKILNSNN